MEDHELSDACKSLVSLQQNDKSASAYPIVQSQSHAQSQILILFLKMLATFALNLVRYASWGRVERLPTFFSIAKHTSAKWPDDTSDMV